MGTISSASLSFRARRCCKNRPSLPELGSWHGEALQVPPALRTHPGSPPDEREDSSEYLSGTCRKGTNRRPSGTSSPSGVVTGPAKCPAKLLHLPLSVCAVGGWGVGAMPAPGTEVTTRACVGGAEAEPWSGREGSGDVRYSEPPCQGRSRLAC